MWQRSAHIFTAASLVSLSAAVHHFKELNGFHDLEQLGFEAGGRALKHSIIGFARKDCESKVRALGFPTEFGTLGEEFETGEVYMDKHSELAQLYNITDCNTFLYFPRGADVLREYERIEHVESPLQLSNWFYEHLRHKLEFVNDLPYPVEVRWEGEEGTESPLISLPPYRSAEVNTFLSHHLVFHKKEVGRDVALFRYRVDEAPSVTLSHFVHTHECVEETASDDHIQLSPEEMDNWRKRQVSNRARIDRNERQPGVKPKFTELGYKKMRLPDHVYQLILNRWNQGKDHPEEEKWSNDDYHTNYFESPSTMVFLSDGEKQQIFDGVQPILEGWAGGVKLVPTSCYGIRLYHNGSWLREHVDTSETHIISAIMQIAQDVDEDWPLTFVDNHGDRHYIYMEPGDLTLYESSTCLHGRPIPFKGRYFANVFVHFKDVPK